MSDPYGREVVEAARAVSWQPLNGSRATLGTLSDEHLCNVVRYLARRTDWDKEKQAPPHVNRPDTGAPDRGTLEAARLVAASRGLVPEPRWPIFLQDDGRVTRGDPWSELEISQVAAAWRATDGAEGMARVILGLVQEVSYLRWELERVKGRVT